MVAVIYVVIVNWNGSSDTIECLESLTRLRTADVRIVVCDNGSSDDSIARIVQWGEGGVVAATDTPAWTKIRTLSGSSEPRHPRTVRVLSPNEAHPCAGENTFVTVLGIGRNLGFAGANNIGLRYALLDAAASAIWLLNNDTIVAPSALDALISRSRSDGTIGMCGATLVYYHNPDIIQAAGGSEFRTSTGRARSLALGSTLGELPATEEIELAMSYVAGASLFVSREFLATIGLMNEDYFLYFEELDWAVRGSGRFRLGFARDAFVFHREGASIGSSSIGRPSNTSLYYLTVNLLRFTRRYYPTLLPVVCARLVLDFWRKLRKNDLRSAKIMAVAAMHWLIGHRHRGLVKF